MDVAGWDEMSILEHAATVASELASVIEIRKPSVIPTQVGRVTVDFSFSVV